MKCNKKIEINKIKERKSLTRLYLLNNIHIYIYNIHIHNILLILFSIEIK